MAKSNSINRERPALVEPVADEQAQQQEDVPEARKIEGHVMWVGGERITGWGEAPARAQ